MINLSEEKKKIKEARPEWTDQELRPLVFQGIIVPDYKVSSDGLVISYKRKTPISLNWFMRSKVDRYPAVTIYVPSDLIDYADENATTYYGKTVGRVVNVHMLVGDVYLDFEHQCPRHLEPWWPHLPLELKKELRLYFHIDHIDDNKCNPDVSNLRFISPRENNVHRKLFTLGPSPKETLEVEAKVNQLMKEQRKKHA